MHFFLYIPFFFRRVLVAASLPFSTVLSSVAASASSSGLLPDSGCRHGALGAAQLELPQSMESSSPPLPQEANGAPSGARNLPQRKRQRHVGEARGGRRLTPATRGQQRYQQHEEKEQKQESTPRNDVEGEPPETKARVESKPHSSFAELHRTLVDGAAVAAYIAEHHDTKLRDPKQINSFFQAISKSADHLFSSLCQEHKREVQLLLERMFELYSSRKAKILPAAHEFLIRCEQNGVREAEWATELNHEATATTTSTSASLHSLLSPRELIKKLAAFDPCGRLERMMEMCSSIADLCACAKKLQTAVKKAAETSEDNELSYAVTCRLISKLASKARRTCKEVHLADSLSPCLSDDDTEGLNRMMGILLEVTKHALSIRPPLVSQQPIAKLAHFSKWCESHGLLLDTSHVNTVASLEVQAKSDLRSQAAQLETVMRLKSLPPSDEAVVRQVLDELWNEKEGHFEPYSVDVLSSIAVVASASGLSDDFRSQVAGRLIRTQQRKLSGSNIQLPRRALNFVNAEHSREKRESIKRMLAAQKDGPEGVN